MKFLICFFFLIIFGNSYSQKDIDPTAEDIVLAKKILETYTKDDIAILESVENINFGINRAATNVTVKNRIQEVLMNIGHRSDIQKYEFYDSESQIDYINLKYRNNKIASFPVKDEFYKDQDYFYHDAKVKYMNIDFPVQGYSYQFELQKNYDDVKYFTSLYFLDEYPILKKEINIVVPDWLDIELKEFHFDGNKITKSSKENPQDKTTTYTFVMENIPAFVKERNAPGKSYSYPHILVIAKSFKNKDVVTPLFSTTADLYKWYKSLVDQLKDDPQVMKEKVLQLVADAKTDEDKIKNIYYWVQDNIRYIAFEDGIAGFKPDESNNVFQKKYGDCKGMANLTKQMLKLAGFDARLTWIGTKHISYDYNTPSLAVDNHMICTLFLKDKKYFLDGTEKYNAFGEYAERIQNKEVMIENGDSYIIEKIPMATAQANGESYKSTLTIEGDQLKGSCFKSYRGESRVQFSSAYNSFKSDHKEEALEKFLSDNNKNLDVHDITTSDLSDRENTLTINYKIDAANRVSAYDNDIYVDLEFMDEYKNFELKDRKADYEFDYKTDYDSQVTLAIPAGYQVSKLPENLNISEPDFDVAITFTQTPDSITYKKTFLFKNAIIKLTDVSKWNAFIKKLNGVYNQQIILSKQI